MRFTEFLLISNFVVDRKLLFLWIQNLVKPLSLLKWYYSGMMYASFSSKMLHYVLIPQKKTMAVMGNSSFWLDEHFKRIDLKLQDPVICSLEQIIMWGSPLLCGFHLMRNLITRSWIASRKWSFVNLCNIFIGVRTLYTSKNNCMNPIKTNDWDIVINK